MAINSSFVRNLTPLDFLRAPIYPSNMLYPHFAARHTYICALYILYFVVLNSIIIKISRPRHAAHSYLYTSMYRVAYLLWFGTHIMFVFENDVNMSCLSMDHHPCWVSVAEHRTEKRELSRSRIRRKHSVRMTRHKHNINMSPGNIRTTHTLTMAWVCVCDHVCLYVRTESSLATYTIRLHGDWKNHVRLFRKFIHIKSAHSPYVPIFRPKAFHTESRHNKMLHIKCTSGV